MFLYDNEKCQLFDWMRFCTLVVSYISWQPAAERELGRALQALCGGMGDDRTPLRYDAFP